MQKESPVPSVRIHGTWGYYGCQRIKQSASFAQERVCGTGVHTDAAVLSGNLELVEKLERLEKLLTARLDIHEKAIFQTLEQLMRLLEPEPQNSTSEESPKKIGFTAKEKRANYLSPGV